MMMIGINIQQCFRGHMCQSGKFAGQWVCDVEYCNTLGKYTESTKECLIADTPYHDRMDNHLKNNIDCNDKLDSQWNDG